MQNDPFTLLVLATVRVTAVLSAVWIITLAMRRAAASSRHFVWTAGIVAAALIPAAAIAMPKWQVQTPAAIAALAPAVRPSFTPAASVPAPPAAERSDVVAAPLAPAANGSLRLPSVSSLAIVTWIVGAGAVLLYLFAGTLAAMRIRRSSSALDARWANEAEALADAMGIRPPAMFATASVPSPMVAGFWRPCILLPPDAASWPDDRLHVVLLHELAHIKRRDCLTQAIAHVVCGIYWFNPLVWIAARRLRMERERACDDFVLAKGTRGSEYANHLLEIAQTARPERLAPLTIAGVAMARRSQLEGRLMAILDPAIRRSSTTAARLAAAAALVAISVPVAAVQLKNAVPVSAVSTGPIRAAVEPVAAPAAAPAAAAPSQAPGTVNAQRPAAPAAQPARDPIIGVALARMLVEAVQRGNREEIAALLGAGANVNTPVPGDGSALIAAAQHGHLDIVQSLLARGADIDLGVPGDGTPLIAAAQRGHLEIARLLLDRGADVHKPFTGDGNPLIAASSRGQVRIAQLLLERGARVEDVVDGDENALISASAQGHLDVVQLLVSQGASVNSRVWVEQTFSRQGGPGPGEWRTPLSMARRGGHAAVVTYLQSRGAVE